MFFLQLSVLQWGTTYDEKGDMRIHRPIQSPETQTAPHGSDSSTNTTDTNTKPSATEQNDKDHHTPAPDKNLMIE